MGQVTADSDVCGVREKVVGELDQGEAVSLLR
jgi:hypothetical protein